MHIRSVMIATIVAWAPLSAMAAISAQTLMKGQSATVSTDYEIGDIAVADQSICDFLVGQDRRSLYLSARGGGETTVTLWDTAGSRRDEFAVHVVTTTLKEVLDRARAEFGDLAGVDIEVRGGHVEVRGEVAEPEDFRRIEGMARQDARVRSRVRIAREVIGEVAKAIRQAVDVPGVTVRDVRDRVVLEGIAYSQADAKRAVEIAKLYSPDVVDLIEVRETSRRVGRGRIIELSFHMMEVKKSALRNLGINWAPGSFAAGSSNLGTGTGAGLFSSIGDLGRGLLGFVFNLVPKLKFIRESGDGRVLENPSIIVKSGEEAKLFSGSEVPYYKGDEVQFKKVGIEIEAVPIEVKGGVDIKLNATLSAPSGDLRGALDTSTVSTSVICPIGQSLVLGNVIRNGDVKMRNRLPRDVDTSSALFTLFLSKDFQSNRSEFLVFVTPRLIDTPTQAEVELREYLATEEAMIFDRSKKEHAAHIAKSASSRDQLLRIFDEETKVKAGRKSRRKWR